MPPNSEVEMLAPPALAGRRARVVYASPFGNGVVLQVEGLPEYHVTKNLGDFRIVSELEDDDAANPA